MGARASIAALLLGACSAPEPTQLVVVVDTDLDIPSELDEIRVEVRGPDGMRQTESTELADRSLLPLTLGVAPGGGSLGPVTVTATGRLSGVAVVERMHRVTLIAGETRTLIMHLSAACAARDAPCASDETCGENGCVDLELDAATLPRWTGTPPRLGDDAGPPPPRDAGQDATVPDGGEDGGPPPCGGPEDCDDGNACTDDACTAGRCAWTPTTAACDDGIFCNGLDSCADGACAAHAGTPCVGSTTCDETGGTCTGCASDADCPMPSVGAWSTCAYAATCAESGGQTRTVRSFTCAAGACVPADAEELRACTRDTDGTTCAMPSCSAWSGCSYGSTCAESGSESRTCTGAASCVAGSCTSPSPAPETRPCSRDTDGSSCGAAASCGPWSGCSYSSDCDEDGTRTRTCTSALTCAGGSCQGGSDSVETDACSRDTDGVSCGTESCSAWSACSPVSMAECETDGTQTRTCTPQVCTGASCGAGSSRVETQACGIDPTGNPCDDGVFCTFDDFCRSTGLCRGIFDMGCIEP